MKLLEENGKSSLDLVMISWLRHQNTTTKTLIGPYKNF